MPRAQSFDEFDRMMQEASGGNFDAFDRRVRAAAPPDLRQTGEQAMGGVARGVGATATGLAAAGRAATGRAGGPPITLDEAMRQQFGESIGGTINALGPLVGPMTGMAMGASRGAALGAPLGPVGAIGGGILGAGVGGALGQVPNEAVTALQEGPGYSATGGLERIAGQGLAGLESQAVFGGIGLAAQGLVKGSRAYFGYTPAAERAALVRASRAHGIDLTAAQETGNPFLKMGQAFALRLPKSAGMMREFGEKQAGQIVSAGERLGETVSGGPLLEQAFRDNRFLTMLKARVTSLKDEEKQLFSGYVRARGGPDVQIADTTLDPVRQAAGAIRGELPIISGLRPSKLDGILKDIEGLGKPKMDPRAEKGIREQFGLRADEPIPAWAVRPDMMTDQPVTLKQLRDIKEALGEIAFPESLAGAVTSDIPARAAKRLYGALMESLKEDATAAGVRPLYDAANQFAQVSIHGPLDTTMYAKVLAGEKDFGAVSKAMFSRADPGVLRDAKAVVSDEGWKLIQQQYWDDVFNSTILASKAEGGAQAFRGREFANRIQKDSKILGTLFDADQVKAIKEFAEVTRMAGDTTSFFLSRDFTMAVISAVGGVPPALRLVTGQGDVGDLSQLGATLILPWALGWSLGDPTRARILASAFRSGGPTRKTFEAMQAVGKVGVRAGLSAVNQPESVSVPVPEGLR